MNSLLLLNISNCGITNLKGIEICTNLRFLNANCNKITSITPLISLTALLELYIEHNNLLSIKECYRFMKLHTLDVSGNSCIKTIEDFSNLSLNKSIQILRLKDTELSKQSNYEDLIRGICPHIVIVDYPNLCNISIFRSIPQFAFSYTDESNVRLRSNSSYHSPPHTTQENASNRSESPFSRNGNGLHRKGSIPSGQNQNNSEDSDIIAPEIKVIL